MSKLLVCNLKNNLLVKDLNNYLNQINELTNKNIVICPSTIYIPYFLKHQYSVGVQNIYPEEKISLTGSIMPKQVYSMGVKYAIIGHGERRINLNEDELTINKKVKSSVENKMNVILCVGETIEENKLFKTERVIKRQLISALRNVSDLSKIIVAYEPLWDASLSNRDIEEMIEFIKRIVELNYKYASTKVIYGGGVNDKNIERLNEISNVDGFLLGSVALDVEKLNKIIEVTL